MNPILSIGLLKLGKEAVGHLVSKQPAQANNAQEVPFSQYMDSVQGASKVTGLSRILQEFGIQNLGDIENTLFHLTQQLVKDPAFAEFSADDFRNGSFLLQGDANGGIHLMGPNGKEVEFSAQSALGEQVLNIRQLSEIFQQAKAALGTPLAFLAGFSENSSPKTDQWNLKLDLR